MTDKEKKLNFRMQQLQQTLPNNVYFYCSIHVLHFVTVAINDWAIWKKPSG
jgi:hypothetical protein